jgi:hypothetical protein
MLKSLHNFFFSILMRFSLFVTTASAIDLDEATRTVVADPAGKTIVLTQNKLNEASVYLTLLVVHVT